MFFFFFQAEDGIRDLTVTGVQTCALPISGRTVAPRAASPAPLRVRPELWLDRRWHGLGAGHAGTPPSARAGKRAPVAVMRKTVCSARGAHRRRGGRRAGGAGKRRGRGPPPR